MSQYKVNFCNLIASAGKSKDYHTVSFSSDKNKTLGELFILGKVKTNNNELKEILNSLIDFINAKYLEQAHPNAEECLEEILQFANQQWQSQLADADISLDDPETKIFFNNLNLIIGILQENTIHFAYVGQANVFLIRKNNIIDILESMDAPENFNFLKIFSNIITGNLKPEDSLFFSLADFTDYFSTEKIKRIVTDYSPEKACDYFQELIKPLETDKTFGLLVFKVNARQQAPAISSPEEEINKATKIPVKQNCDSMHELVLKQKKTQEFIQPKIAPKINKKIGQKSAGLARKIFKPLKKNFKSLGEKIKSINFRDEIKGSVDIKVSDNKNNIEKGEPKRQRTIYLPKQNKLYIIISLVFVVLIVGIIAYSINHQTKKKQEEEYQKIVSQIEEKQNLISAAMMYGDNNRAQELLEEISELISQVPNNEEYQTKFAELEKQNQEKLDEMLKLYKIEPEKIAELTYNVSNLIYTPDNLYTWQDNYLINIDLENDSVQKLSELKSDYGNIKIVTPLNENSLLINTTENKFVRFDTDGNSYFDFSVDTQEMSSNVSDMLSYGSRLYALDKSKNQIYKFQTVDEEFGDESAWIKDNLDLSGLNNIAIDGNIWSIDSDGQIYKFYGGEKETYAFTVQPAIENAVKIYTELDWQNLYILDANSNRVIILNKDSGQVVKQYHADTWQNIKDIIPVESDDVIYVLNDNVIYEAGF